METVDKQCAGSTGAPNKEIVDREAALRDLPADAILHLEGIADEADRTIRRLRLALLSLERESSTESLG
jgi:hypothetical protein